MSNDKTIHVPEEVYLKIRELRERFHQMNRRPIPFHEIIALGIETIDTDQFTERMNEYVRDKERQRNQ